MAYSRRVLPEAPLEGSALDAAMVGVGMLFTADGAPNTNIEDTVLAASIAGMRGGGRTSDTGVSLPRR